MSTILRRLVELYGDTAEMLRLTERGIWHATPVRVLAAAVDVIRHHSMIQRGNTVLDAGVGDGRVLAALALGFPDLGLNLIGLDCDRELIATARTKLASIPASARVEEGDFLSDDTISTGDVVFHYPDGSERELFARFHRTAKRTARLMILSPESSPDLGAVPVSRLEVRLPGEPIA